MPPLAIGLRMAPKEFHIVDLDEFDFERKINDLKSEITTKTGIEKDTMELIYCGNILEDDMTLMSCGVKAGVMVHALKKKPKEVPIPTQPMSEQDIKALVIAFRTLTLNPSHRNSLQKLSRPDILENILLITPGLINDPVAISLIQDPELMVRLANFDTVRRIVEQHPALAEAANHIAATVHEEALHNQFLHNHTTSPTTSAGYSLLDILSDDDEMESSQSSDSLQPGMSRQPSFSGITTAQLAAALASASAREGEGTEGGNSGGTNPSGSGLMPEMMSLGRAVANFFADRPNEGGNTEPSSNIQEQMQQMRELGLLDDAINLQALQLAGGNLQAAVELVFSGAIGPDPST